MKGHIHLVREMIMARETGAGVVIWDSCELCDQRGSRLRIPNCCWGKRRPLGLASGRCQATRGRWDWALGGGKTSQRKFFYLIKEFFGLSSNSW